MVSEGGSGLSGPVEDDVGRGPQRERGMWFWSPETKFGDPELVGGIPITEAVDENGNIESES